MGLFDHCRMFPFILLLFSAFLLPTTIHCLRSLTVVPDSPAPAPSVPDSVEAICNLTTHPSICISAVVPHLPNPSTTTSVLLVLLESAKNETATDKATFHDLAKNPNATPKMLAALKACEMQYGDSLDDYKDAIAAVKVKDWYVTNMYLEGVLFSYSCCEDGDAPGLPPVGDGPWVAFNRRLRMFVDDCSDLISHL